VTESHVLNITDGVQLSLGYHLRKASMLDTPEWLTVTTKAAKIDPYVALIDICISIPRLLERTDRLAADGSSPAEIDALIEDSDQIANRAFEWLSNFERTGPRYDQADIETFAAFLTICNDRVFNPVYDFHYFGAGICYMIYWMSMLIMQSNTFKLLRQYRQLEMKQLYMWDRQLNSYADCICRSIPYHCRPMSGYTARFGALTPLVVARMYYEAKGPAKEAETKWCEKAYLGARIPGLYQMEVPLEPLKAVKDTLKDNKRFI
jgi:hypothetical protein